MVYYGQFNRKPLNRSALNRPDSPVGTHTLIFDLEYLVKGLNTYQNTFQLRYKIGTVPTKSEKELKYVINNPTTLDFELKYEIKEATVVNIPLELTYKVKSIKRNSYQLAYFVKGNYIYIRSNKFNRTAFNRTTSNRAERVTTISMQRELKYVIFGYTTLSHPLKYVIKSVPKLAFELSYFVSGEREEPTACIYLNCRLETPKTDNIVCKFDPYEGLVCTLEIPKTVNLKCRLTCS